MMKVWLAVLVLLVASAAYGDPVKLALFPDPQNIVQCNGLAPRWDIGSLPYTWVAEQGDVDYAIIPGDVVQKNACATAGNDCWCLAQEEPLGGCGAITGHPLGYTCTQCGDLQSARCDGGEAGMTCEWTRIRGLGDILEEGGVPAMFADGNHDYDVSPSGLASSFENWTLFNEYFGTRSSRYVEASGHKIFDTMGSDIAAVQWNVFEAGGALHLVISVPLHPWWRGTLEKAGAARNEIRKYILEVTDLYPKIPTILVGHTAVTADGTGSYHPSGRDCGFCEKPGDAYLSASTLWQGKDMYEIAELRPQVWLIVGGHDRATRYFVQTMENGKRILGILIDYSFGLDHVADVADGTYLDYNYANLYGGPLVWMLNIDLNNGRIWNWAHSSHPDASDGTVASDGRDTRYDGEWATHWTVLMPFCRDESRFNLPAAACPDLAPPAAVAR